MLLENLKTLTVIYVEDDNLTRKLIKQALETLVKEIHLAKNGEEGLKLYKNLSPNIVLTDMYMPKMNGLEMAKKIKEINPNQPIGMFTGDNEEDIKNQSNADLIDIFLHKPLNRKQFFTALDLLYLISINSCEKK